MTHILSLLQGTLIFFFFPSYFCAGEGGKKGVFDFSSLSFLLAFAPFLLCYLDRGNVVFKQYKLARLRYHDVQIKCNTCCNILHPFTSTYQDEKLHLPHVKLLGKAMCRMCYILNKNSFN